jgi:outer membrane protein TolC
MTLRSSIFRCALSAILPLAFGVPLGAQTRLLDESAAVALALAGDASVAVQRIDLEAKERRAALSGNLFIPSLSASATARNSLSESRMAPGTYEWTPSNSIRVSSSLSLSAADLQEMETASLDASLSRSQLRAAEEKVERATRTAFYKLLLLKEQVRVAEVALEVARGTRDRTAEEYRAGLASQRTMRQAEIAWESERLGLERRRNEYLTARASFSRTVGIESDGWEPEGSLDAPGPASLSASGLDLSFRADVAGKRAEEAVQLSKLEKERRAARIPTLGLTGSYERTYLETGDSYTASLSVTLSSPNLTAFLPFSKESVGIGTAAAAAEKLRLQSEDALRTASLEVEALIRQLSVSTAAISSLSASLALAQESVVLAAEAYAAGAASYQDLRTAEKEADAARLALLSERYTYRIALIDLEYATGKRFSAAKEPS